MSNPDGEAYDNFAYAYDKALGDRFFAAVAPLLDWILRKYPPPGRRHLDLACGTGLAVEYLASRGFSSIGVDASASMLDVARTRARRLVAGDLRQLPLSGSFDLVTCLYDSLNHFLEPDDLARVFASAHRLTGPDGFFIFDMNHPRVYPKVWGMDEPFVSESSEHSLTLATRFEKPTQRGHARVTGWALAGGRKVTIDEEHHQRAYTEREVVTLLRKANLTPVEIVDFDPFQEQEAEQGVGVKFLFVVRRI